MIISYRYRLLPTKRQHRVLEAIVEAQRQLYNAALEERIDAYGPREVGIDLGIRSFATLSDGVCIPSLKAAHRAERRLRVVQRALSRKKPASRNRAKARLILARSHAAIARRRANHLHQASANLVRDYDLIAIEALNVKALARGNLAKSVRDAAWARFISMLRYKAERAGASLVEVNPRSTTQDCSGCGSKVPKGLGDRQHECQHCGLSIDRDLNAARNILYRAGVGPGLRNVAGSRGMRAGGNISSISPAF